MSNTALTKGCIDTKTFRHGRADGTRERRLAMVLVMDDVIAMLGKGFTLAGMLHTPEGHPIQLPGDAEVIAVHYNHLRRAFEVTLWSSQFPVLKPGMALTELGIVEGMPLSLETPED